MIAGERCYEWSAVVAGIILNQCSFNACDWLYDAEDCYKLY